MNIFIEISVILIITSIISLILHSFKQPLVIGYILSGIIIGPYILNILSSSEQVELFSKIGIVILLFIVGLGLNPLTIKEVGRASFWTGICQVVFTVLFGFLLVRFLGYDIITALYIGVALTFSSTIIVLKLLTDKGDTHKLYGKIAIGILLIQDLIATLILLFIATFSNNQNLSLNDTLIIFAAKTLIVIFILIIFSKYMLPKIGNWFASSQELLFISSLAWGLGVASMFAVFGFSIEIGALVAGIALSMSPYSYEISSRLKPIKDFFVTIFFILLGSHLILTNIHELIYTALILSVFVLLIKPIIVLIVMNIFGYKRKVGFITGLTIAQISEFSLILTSIALTYKHINQEAVTLIALVGIITIGLSSYMIIYSEKIYNSMQRIIKIFDIPYVKKNNFRDHKNENNEVILFGYDRVGHYFIEALEHLQKKYLVIDFNPKSIRKLEEKKVNHRYGDAEDVEFLDELGLQYIKMIISTIPDKNVNMTMLTFYRKINPSGIVILISHDIHEAKELYLAGATYVVIPHNLGATHAAHMIEQYGFDLNQFEIARNKHLQKILEI